MQLTVKATLTTALFAASMHAAQAGTVDALKLLNDYNLIVSGNVTSNSHVDGNALIGGNVDGGTYNMHTTSNAAVPSLTVGGNASGNIQTKGQGINVGGNIQGSVIINDGGNAYVGSVSGSLTNNANGKGATYVVGNISGTVNTNGGNTYYGGTLSGTANGATKDVIAMPFDPVNLAGNAIATLSGFSVQLADIAANNNYGFLGNKVSFNAVEADANGLAAFTINDANDFFSKAGEFDFNLASGVQTVLINVINSDINAALNLNVNFLAGSANNYGKNILWNFQNASIINLNTQFGGSLLALDATVMNGNNIEGTLVAKSLVQRGEIHYQGLASGADDFGIPPQNVPNTGTVPLPGTIPLLAIGLAGFGAIARRNRKAA